MNKEKLAVVGALIVAAVAHELDMPVEPEADRVDVPEQAAVRPRHFVLEAEAGKFLTIGMDATLRVDAIPGDDHDHPPHIEGGDKSVGLTGQGMTVSAGELAAGSAVPL